MVRGELLSRLRVPAVRVQAGLTGTGRQRGQRHAAKWGLRGAVKHSRVEEDGGRKSTKTVPTRGIVPEPRLADRRAVDEYQSEGVG